MNDARTFANREQLDAALADHIAERLAAAVATRGSASLAVSGGSTPKGMFDALSHADIPWPSVWITLVDERWVAPDHPDSNERLVREHLLQNRAAAANFIGLKGAAPDAEDGLEEVRTRLTALPLPLDCVVLGMGGDGHTASWFPRARNLDDMLDPDNTNLLASCEPMTAPHQRITLTLPVVLAAGDIALHFTGDDKRAVLAEAADKHYPIHAVTGQHQNPATLWWAP